MKENLFAAAASQRQEDQISIEKNIVKSNFIEKRGKKVRFNVTLHEDIRDRLQAEADRRGVSASMLIQILVERYC